ncbi:MAG: EAL domain-containing protein, partial [Gammaproteobacteria bacterium]
ETAVVENLAQMDLVIEELRVLGCRFSLDDFGTGMASYSYLKRLSVDYLKIDGSFIRNILADSVDQAMVRSMQEVASEVRVKTIAEQVDSNEALQLLKKIGIDYVQGYHLHRPQPLDEIRLEGGINEQVA